MATLKQQNYGLHISETSHIFKLIRSKYTKKTLNIENFDDDKKLIMKNLRGYCKEMVEKEDTIK